jgi:hypothetical protein
MIIIRRPQQGHGRDNMRGWSASAVASGISGCLQSCRSPQRVIAQRFCAVALSVTSLRRTIGLLLEKQRTLIGTGTKCIGRE